jgi:putative membrane protein
LLLLGTPGWMLQPLLRNRAVFRAVFVLTRPLAAFLLFNGVILVTHLPAVVDLTLRHHPVHFVAHLCLVATALLMWMPVLSPVAELPRIGPFAQLVYLFVQSLLPAVIASFLAFSDRVVYQFYADAPLRYWGLDAHVDQQIAAVIMKLGGSAVLWGVMAYVFFRWFSQDQPDRRPERDVGWPEVEAELERMGLTKPAESHR